MAPRLSRPPDPSDPEYQSLERRINLALHIAIFAVVNSGVWFWRSLHYADWQWTIWLTSLWALVILIHGIWVFSKERQ